MAFDEPEIYHALMEKLTDAVITYTRYQIESGAQVVQIFDSWASEWLPKDFSRFCLPHLTRVIKEVKQTHPDTPLILYCSGAGGFLERLQTTGADVISLMGRWISLMRERDWNGTSGAREHGPGEFVFE